MTSNLTLESAGEWQNIRHRTRPDLRETQIGFNVVQDVTRRDGTYRPARNLPVQYTRGNWVDSEGIVISQGKILGKYDPQVWDAVGNAWVRGEKPKHFGMNDITNGKFYAYKDVTGTPKLVDYNEPIYGYSEDIKGFIAPMNGNIGEVQDYYSSHEKQLGSLDSVSGVLAGTGAGFESNATLRAPGDPAGSPFELIGVAQRDIMRETRNNAYQYSREAEAHGVAKDGYLYVPFVIGTTTVATLGDTDMPLDGATVINPATADGTSTYEISKQRLVSFDQTILFVEGQSVLQHGAVIYVDNWGNPLLPSSATGGLSGAGNPFNLEFGTLVDFHFAIDIPYGDYAQTYPFIEVAGSSTLGIDHALMYLGRKIKGDVPAKTLADHLRSSKLYGWAKIRFDIP